MINKPPPQTELTASSSPDQDSALVASRESAERKAACFHPSPTLSLRLCFIPHKFNNLTQSFLVINSKYNWDYCQTDSSSSAEAAP